ncbi:MAG: T9SS C-terminal target domain-containing protein, partial [Flavobacteriales bacterium]|nr:T9SS C-terminal target domain-containing protein [Flavobacteriales bacterium]
MRCLTLITIGAVLSVNAMAREDLNKTASNVNKNGGRPSIAAACDPPSAQTDLDINNVRARVLSGMDMWWDFNTAKYEVPKGSNKNSLFAGSLWLGGVDAGGQLKVAAQTYRQRGWDIWPGPLNTVTATTDADVCSKYDKHFKVTRTMVESFASDPNYPTVASIPQAILDWPAHGDNSYGQDYYLAPFYDYDGDGNYNPYAGDYPDYDISGDAGCSARLFGDQTLWWVFNDKGDIHTESGGEPMGIEVHAQAFAFATNDEINNMTFYQYRIFNRSSFQVNNTYFGQWVDPDLGNYLDDFVGCDVGRGLGYCYNGDADDDGAQGYGTNPPAIGVDFFQGPRADDNDGIDNDRDGTIDEPGELIIMSKFVYYNNDQTVTGNPEIATDYYNYLTGFWKDGVPFTYGSNAYNTGGPLCDFMFPGDSDPLGWGTGGVPQAAWDEASSGNTPADRRFLQSAGPFTLKPGAVNTITTGAVWVRAAQGGNSASVQLLRLTDDKAQALFDNCFKVLNGPDAPDLTIQEMNKQLIVYITNKPSSNNY